MIMLIVTTLAITIPSILTQYQAIQKFGDVAVIYAEKNGGFVTAQTQDGDIIMNPEVYLRNLIQLNALDRNIDFNRIEFQPPLGTKVNKRGEVNKHGEFRIVIRDAVVRFRLPFVSNESVLKLNDIVCIGYSHKYFK